MKAARQERGKTVQQWLAAINGHDVSALAALMAAEFVFIDALGQRVEGSTAMESGWRSYFAMCPDYRIRADHVMGEGNTMLLAGQAGGTIDGQPWSVPAAWKAVVRDGLLTEWRVYSDNRPVSEILAKRP